ncbi:MAG: GxxExxY protein [Candidatus Heimdallarchaeaceae archaeon]
MKELEELIIRAIFNKAKELQEDRSDTIHVTDLTGCIRKSYYIKKHGFPLDEKMAFWLIFGALVHDILTPVIAEHLNGEREVRTVYEYKGVEIQATVDVLAEDVVVELKTCNKIPYQPYQSHIEQINAYMHFFDVPLGIIVYVSRTQLGVKIFEYYGDWQLLQYTLDKAIILNNALENNTPPPCNLPLSERKFYCRECYFKTQCLSDSEMLDSLD